MNRIHAKGFCYCPQWCSVHYTCHTNSLRVPFQGRQGHLASGGGRQIGPEFISPMIASFDFPSLMYLGRGCDKPLGKISNLFCPFGNLNDQKSKFFLVANWIPFLEQWNRTMERCFLNKAWKSFSCCLFYIFIWLCLITLPVSAHTPGLLQLPNMLEIANATEVSELLAYPELRVFLRKRRGSWQHLRIMQYGDTQMLDDLH